MIKTFSGNNPENWLIDRSWTVFLDRDGVINKKIDDDYVRNLAMFEWLPGAIESIKQLSKLFGRVIIVTNQQGVGKKLMTEKDVNIVHDFILKEVAAAGGRIDRIYFSPYLKSDNHPTRKPGIGMALLAKNDFPEIDFTKSVIIGDSLSDMQFGEAAGMKKVYVQHKSSGKPDIQVDAIVTSIQEVLGLFSNNR